MIDQDLNHLQESTCKIKDNEKVDLVEKVQNLWNEIESWKELTSYRQGNLTTLLYNFL
jgi:hypothetical protein